ncbi:hypothetical protein TNIN_455881, partial [Trichonephila inaurata madagascariensis]
MRPIMRRVDTAHQTPTFRSCSGEWWKLCGFPAFQHLSFKADDVVYGLRPLNDRFGDDFHRYPPYNINGNRQVIQTIDGVGDQILNEIDDAANKAPVPPPAPVPAPVPAPPETPAPVQIATPADAPAPAEIDPGFNRAVEYIPVDPGFNIKPQQP